MNKNISRALLILGLTFIFLLSLPDNSLAGEGTIRLRPINIPDGIVNKPYAFDLNQLIVPEAGAPVTPTSIEWGLASGSLPDGIILTNDGRLTGTPKTPASSVKFEIVAGYRNGTGRQSYSISVGAIGQRVVQVAVGSSYSCAVTEVGALVCWGAVPGRGRVSPVTIIDSGVKSVAAGEMHVCVTVFGAVKCFGVNGYGQLGNGTTQDSNVPVTVIGLERGVVSVSTSSDYGCAVLESGEVKCWGKNAFGRLGDGKPIGNDFTIATTPVSVVGLKAKTVSVGSSHACAITVEGGVKCWGMALGGQLGDGGDESNKSTPVSVFGLKAGVTAISVGNDHTCAVVFGALKCWGSDWSGKLGDGGFAQSQRVPTDVTGLSSGVTSVSAGEISTCAVASGKLKCWGSALFGQIGDGIQSRERAHSTPVDVTAIRSDVSHVSVGDGHTCAVVAGLVKCWGSNGVGQLGVSNTARVIPYPSDVLQ